MDLSTPGWLADLLSRILAGYDPERAVARLAPSIRGEGPGARLSPAQRARQHIATELRRSGLVYGTPKLLRRVAMGQRIERSDALFLATISAECLLALDVARIFGVPFHRARSETELTMFLAAAIGAIELAAELLTKVVGGDPRALDGLQLRVEQALLARTPQVTGDPAFDLPLHDAIAWGEGRLVEALAIDWFGKGRFDAKRAARLYGLIARERAVLLEAILALSQRHHAPTDTERRTVRRLLRGLPLTRTRAREVRAAIDAPPTPERLAQKIRSRPLRRFLLEQVHLGALADGVVDEAEALFYAQLATAFGADAPELARIEATVADFFADPADVLDAFEVLAAGQRASEAVVDRIARELVENLDRVGNEVKETGELGLLLAKAARGHKLTPAERAKAREQLLDLAKVVPSLAIIAAPGGMLIFAALLKVLPFSILPSSFHPKERTRPGERAIVALRRRREGD